LLIDKVHLKVYQGAMRENLPALRPLKGRRLIGFFLFLAVFFLPLHFHAAVPTPKLAKECSCIHGSRTEAGLTAPPAKWVPVVIYQSIELDSQTEFVSRTVSSRSSRGPPSLDSL
jgi:hypothetical protein